MKLKRKNKAGVNLITGRHQLITIISSVSKAVQNCVLLKLLMMIAEPVLSKRPVLRLTEAIFLFSKLFSPHI